MTTCEDIGAGLQGIIDQLEAIANKPCCPTGTTTGSRGAGSTAATPNPYDQAATPTTPPPGFDDMTEFNSHKCNAAQDIVNALMQDLQGLAGITYIGSTIPLLVEAAIAVLLTPIPYDDIIFLVSLLLFTVIEYTFLVLLSDEIFNNNDNLVCVLYNSPDSINAQASFRTELYALIDAQSWIDAEKDFVTSAIDHMTPTDAMNKMFVDLPTVAQNADCTGCGDCAGPLTTAWNYCSSSAYTPGTNVSSITGSTCGISGLGTHRVLMFFNFDGTDFTGPEINPEVVLVSVTIEGGGFTSGSTPVGGWGYYHQEGAFEHFDDQQTDQCIGYLLICSKSAFTVTIDERA